MRLTPIKHLAAYGLTVGVLFLSLAAPATAATGSIYLSPSGPTVYSGATVQLSVRMNSSDPVNAVQADLSYPTATLDYLSTSFSGSAFEIGAQSTGGSGSVQIGRGTLSAVSGDQLIAVVSFRAKAGSGNATVSVAGSSSLVNNGVEVLSVKGTSTINFATTPAAPAPTPAPTPTPTPTTPKKSPSTTPSTTPTTPTPTVAAPDTSAPTISQISNSATSVDSITVMWTTNEPSTSVVEYGLNSAYGLSVTNDEKVTLHKIVISSLLLVPKTEYHIRISSTDASGNVTKSKDIIATTKGIALEVTVVDAQKKPFKDASVTIDGVTNKTNEKGVATFDLAPGKKSIIANIYGVSKTATFTLGATTGHTTTISLDAKAPFPWTAVLIVPLLLIGVLLGHFVWRRRSNPNEIVDPVKLAETSKSLYGTDNPYEFAMHLPKQARIIDITPVPSAFGAEVASLRPDVTWVNFIYDERANVLNEVVGDMSMNIRHITGNLSNLQEVSSYDMYDRVFATWLWGNRRAEYHDAARILFAAAKPDANIAIVRAKGAFGTRRDQSSLMYETTKDGGLDVDVFAAAVISTFAIEKIRYLYCIFLWNVRSILHIQNTID